MPEGAGPDKLVQAGSVSDFQIEISVCRLPFWNTREAAAFGLERVPRRVCGELTSPRQTPIFLTSTDAAFWIDSSTANVSCMLTRDFS